MPNRDNTGFRPANGIGTAHICRMFPVDVANGTAIFIGDVVDLDPNGGVIPAAADAGVSAAGVCIGVFDSNRIPCGHPYSSVSTKQLTASVAGFCLVAMAYPGSVFIAQSSTGSTAPAENDIGSTCDHIAGTGNTTFGFSGHELDFGQTTALNTGLQFRTIGKVNHPNNAYGQHCDLYVVFNESAFGSSAAAGI